MSRYDPQRNRPRQQPKEDEPAPVDALLGGAPEHPHADEIGHAHEHEHEHGPAHEHGPGCDHDHDHGGGPGRVVAAVGAAIGAAAVWRWWRRRRAD